MTSGTIVHGEIMVAGHDAPAQRNGAILVKDAKIVEVGDLAAMREKAPEASILGGEGMLLIPGLVNAHSHGKGLSDFQRGTRDDFLEAWTLDTLKLKPLDVYDDVSLAAANLLSNGVTTTMHNHSPVVVDCQEQWGRAIQAYGDTGIRVQFNPSIIEFGRFVYGGRGENRAFISSLPEPVQAALLAPPPPGMLTADGYVQEVLTLHDRAHGPMSVIGFGPLGPHMVSEDLLLQIRRAADALKAPIHVHALQTMLQRDYFDRAHAGGLVRRLQTIGFLGPRLVIGHGTWLDEADILLLAESGAGVTHHPACNLRIRSGIAPLPALLQAGVTVGLGLDDKSLSDDNDMLQEMRLAYLLHRVAEHEIGASCPSPRELLRMATSSGAQLLGLDGMTGRLAPGMAADLLLLDYQAMCAPYASPDLDPIEVLVQRGSRHHVHTVMVNGRVVVRDGRVLSVDRPSVGRRLAEQAGGPLTDQEAFMAGLFDCIKAGIVRHYSEA